MNKKNFIPVILYVLAAATFAPANVVIKRDPADIQYKTFDPANPPEGMPHLNRGEDAVTTTSFRILAGTDYEPVSRTKGDDGGWTTVVVVHGVTISLQMHVVVYVPQGVNAKLRAHEEGHRKISEQVYKDRALAAAKTAGALIDGKRVTGTGPSWKAAAQQGVGEAINEVGKEYLRRTSDIADRVNDIYDEITHHGTNDVPEADAIKQAFERYIQEHPTTRPAATSQTSSQ